MLTGEEMQLLVGKGAHRKSWLFSGHNSDHSNSLSGIQSTRAPLTGALYLGKTVTNPATLQIFETAVRRSVYTECTRASGYLASARQVRLRIPCTRLEFVWLPRGADRTPFRRRRSRSLEGVRGTWKGNQHGSRRAHSIHSSDPGPHPLSGIQQFSGSVWTLLPVLPSSQPLL